MPTRKNYSTETTYKVIADNCNTCPKITYERGGLTKNTARFVATNLSQAFRRVDVLCEQTGEVMYNIYYSDDFIRPDFCELTAISVVESTLSD